MRPVETVGVVGVDGAGDVAVVHRADLDPEGDALACLRGGSEYGSPENSEAFEWLRSYSPYHNVAERPCPATLFATAAGDTRVHPAHARKMTARVQAATTGGEDPLRVDCLPLSGAVGATTG